MKTIIFILIYSFSILAYAGGYGGTTNNYYSNNYYSTEINNHSSNYHSDLSQALALDAIHCSTSTKKHQMGVGAGYSEGENGFALGYCKTTVTDGGVPVMLNGAAAVGTDSKPKYSVGVNWTF